jgi:hypothetical protein
MVTITTGLEAEDVWLRRLLDLVMAPEAGSVAVAKNKTAAMQADARFALRAEMSFTRHILGNVERALNSESGLFRLSSPAWQA